ncbi:MAG: hypothetical protein P4L96_03875 [Rhodoferax sp.]|nr:hypothetical protein [Rhodoferax sp.]
MRITINLWSVFWWVLLNALLCGAMACAVFWFSTAYGYPLDPVVDFPAFFLAAWWVSVLLAAAVMLLRLWQLRKVL